MAAWVDFEDPERLDPDAGKFSPYAPLSNDEARSRGPKVRPLAVAAAGVVHLARPGHSLTLCGRPFDARADGGKTSCVWCIGAIRNDGGLW